MSRLAASFAALLATAFATAVTPQEPAATDPSAPRWHGPEEGLWAWSHLPWERLHSAGADAIPPWEPTPEWFDRLRTATVQLGRDASGIFVSTQGLLLTCHHGVGPHLEGTTAGERAGDAGWLAQRPEDELAIPGLTAEVLIEVRDVTAEVAGAEDPDAEITRLQGQFKAATTRARVHSRWGDQVHLLHVYERFTDVRLVWLPPVRLGQFGGRRDNYTFPRFSLDAALLRVYRDGRPATAGHHLPVRQSGPRQGELVLTVGHPDSLDRLDTAAELAHYRDHVLPLVVGSLSGRLSAIDRLPEMDPLAQARVDRERSRLANGVRALEGELTYLQQPGRLDSRRRQEDLLAAESTEIRGILDAIDKGRERSAAVYAELWHSSLPGSLVRRVRRVNWAARGDAERRRRIADGIRDEEPMVAALEASLLTEALRAAKAGLGPDHPVVAAMTAGVDDPKARIGSVLEATVLMDSAAVARALKQDPDGLRDDPAVQLVLAVDEARVASRTAYRDIRIEERTQRRMLDAARFAAWGHQRPPDGDGTLRLSFGAVQGLEVGNLLVPPRTTLGGMFARHDAFDGVAPFDLPAAILELRDRLDLTTPLCFASTADVTGGFSGSPVVDPQGRVLGVVFDGNEASLGARFAPPPADARAVAVTSAAILELLRITPGAEALRRELMDGR